MSREDLGKFMATVATRKRLHDSPVGEYRDHQGVKIRRDPRPPGYVLGSLPEARATFTEVTQLPVDWEDDASETTRRW